MLLVATSAQDNSRAYEDWKKN